MTEQEAMNKIQEVIMKRRKYLGISDHSYCTICHNIDARYLTSSVVDRSTECEECYAKRIYKGLAQQITESDSKLQHSSTEIKEQRAQTVRDYFLKRKQSEH